MFAYEEKKVQGKSGGVVQRATVITPTTTNYTYCKVGTTTVTTVPVGKKVVAILDPNDKRKGSETSSAEGRASHKYLTKKLKQLHHIPKGHLIKGHLLNANLGGRAIEENLFPITKTANNNHKDQVETAVKAHYQSDQPNGVGKSCEYTVEVNGGFNETSPNATFTCTFVDTSVTPNNTIINNHVINSTF